MEVSVESKLLSLLPKDQVDIILRQDRCELDFTFLGFTDIYEHLSYIIPEHFVILDLGCYLASQSFYFRKHKAYVGVDTTNLKRFKFKNTTHYIKDIRDFLIEDLYQYDLSETFAICSYVPIMRTTQQMLKERCKNIFMFYPSDKKNNKDIAIRMNLRKQLEV